MSSSYSTPRGLSQLDPGGVLKNSHEIKAEALRTLDIDNLVGTFFTRAEVTYNGQDSATSASFYYDKDEHSELISVLSDVSGNLNNRYFYINGPRGVSSYYVWYDVDGTGVDPAIAGRQGIQVPISSDDSANIVALATRMALNLNSDFNAEFLSTNIDGKVRVVSRITGESVFTDVTSGFTFDVLHQGVTEFIKTIELPYENGVRYVYNEYEKTFEIFPSISSETSSIRIGDDDGDYLNVNPDGSINVVVSSTSGTVLTSTYYDVANVVQGITTLVATYSAVANRKLQKIEFSGTNVAEYELVINGVTQDKKRTYFGNSLNGVFDFGEGLSLVSGQDVEVYVVHYRPDNGDFNCRMQILET